MSGDSFDTDDAFFFPSSKSDPSQDATNFPPEKQPALQKTKFASGYEKILPYELEQIDYSIESKDGLYIKKQLDYQLNIIPPHIRRIRIIGILCITMIIASFFFLYNLLAYGIATICVGGFLSLFTWRFKIYELINPMRGI